MSGNFVHCKRQRQRIVYIYNIHICILHICILYLRNIKHKAVGSGGAGEAPPPNNFYLYKTEQNTQTRKVRA